MSLKKNEINDSHVLLGKRLASCFCSEWNSCPKYLFLRLLCCCNEQSDVCNLDGCLGSKQVSGWCYWLMPFGLQVGGICVLILIPSTTWVWGYKRKTIKECLYSSRLWYSPCFSWVPTWSGLGVSDQRSSVLWLSKKVAVWSRRALWRREPVWGWAPCSESTDKVSQPGWPQGPCLGIGLGEKPSTVDACSFYWAGDLGRYVSE